MKTTDKDYKFMEDLDPVVELLRGCEAVKPEADNIPTNKE